MDRWQILAAKYECGIDNRAYRFDLRYNKLIRLIVSPDGSFSNGYLLEASPPLPLSRF